MTNYLTIHYKGLEEKLREDRVDDFIQREMLKAETMAVVQRKNFKEKLS